MAATLFQKPTPGSGIFYAQAVLPGMPFANAFNLTQAWVPAAHAPPPAQTVQSIALLDAWAQGGIFLFLGASLSDEASFLSRLAILTSHPQFRAARLLWIANPNAREDQWVIWDIRVSANPDGTSRVGALALFDFGNYALAIGGGSSFTPRESSFVIAPPDADSIFLTVQYGARRLPAVPHGPVTISYVDSPGCLCFPMQGGTTFFDDVDAGCRLFFPNRGGIGSIRYPIFASPPAVEFDATLDPLAPLDPSRTAFAFRPGQVLSSYFRTNAGRGVTLVTMTSSRLLFSRMPEPPQQASASGYYLIPDGPFVIQAPGSPPRLLCGIFGAEFIELTADSIITFVAGQAAFVPAFNPADIPAPGTPVVQYALAPAATTSWAAVSSPSVTLCYSAAPDGSGFFRPAASQDLSLLEYYNACSDFLPLSAAAPHPLMPYAGVQADDLTATFVLEQRLLAPVRRQIIQANQASVPVPPPTGDTVDVLTVTPQGMVAQFSADRTQWKTLTVGVSETGPFQLTDIGDPLRSAVLTNQQFVVISDPAALSQHFGTGQNTIQMKGWKFTLDQAGWSRYGSILIVKNSPRPLHELAGDPNSWTLADQFNASVPTTVQRLTGILAQAAQSSSAVLDYFVNTVSRDPAWNGVLILNCPLTSLPPDFQGLTSAIDPSGLFAHHVGFNQTAVARTFTAQNTEMSSLFGLIDYSNDSVAAGTADFEFKVTLLQVLFRNSAISSLAVQADLYVRVLFGSPVSANSRAPLKLTGTMETHGSATVFGMVGAEAPPRTLALDDSVLTGVRIGNIHFGTKSAAPLTSRFDFWGGLQFAVLQGSDGPFDFFSYDNLSFSKMGANLTVGPDGQTQVFQFDPFGMAFDASASQARADSLAAQFPMQLKGFTFSADKSTPTSAGYLAAALSQVDLAAVNPPWYGLVFNLNLGTLGTLAGDVGLVATFAAIWSPGGGAPRAFAGIHLPGLSGGQNQVSLMGVVKVGMHSVELVKQGGNFVLLFDGIAVSLFGKRLPPGGSFDFYLFGSRPGVNQLAWYGAYLKNQ